MASEFKRILEELDNQGWAAEKTANGHYKLTPPDSSKQIVHMSDSGDPRAVMNAIRDLRGSGFTWPVPTKRELRAQERRSELPPGQPPAVNEEEPHYPKDMDTLYAELKDAKFYLQLSTEHLADCRHAAEMAQKALKDAEVERLRASDQLKAKKKEFDTSFERDEAA